MEVLLKVLTLGGAAYAALLGIVFVLQGHLLYFPDAGRQILLTPKPMIHGAQTAMVVGSGEIDTDKLGRVNPEDSRVRGGALYGIV